MSYLSALARQTGVRIGGRPVRSSAPARAQAMAIDVEEVRTVVSAASQPAAPPVRFDVPVNPRSPANASTEHADDPIRRATAAPATDVIRRPTTIEQPLPPADTASVDAASIASITVSPSPRQHVAQATFVSALQPTPPSPVDHESAAMPAAPAPGRPTFDEVRRWVAHVPVEGMPGPLPATAHVRGSGFGAHPPAAPGVGAIDDVERFTIEIGSIEITTGAPAAPVAVAPAPQPPSNVRDASSTGRASRHYIRC